MSTSIAVAGDGTIGNASDRLHYPSGLFVTIDWVLYVADLGNSRIQMFPAGQMNGTSVAGVGAPGTVELLFPKAVVLDAHGYMFIVDQLANCIFGQGPQGFRCIAGCSNTNGPASNEFDAPFALSFDSHGNIFVLDLNNQRIQKLLLATNFCRK